MKLLRYNSPSKAARNADHARASLKKSIKPVLFMNCVIRRDRLTFCNLFLTTLLFILCLMPGARPCLAGEEASIPIQIQRVAINDIHIAYKVFEPSQNIENRLSPLVMITGYGGLMEMWPPALIEPLAHDRRVIVFDNRGLGYSTSSDRDFSIELFVDDTLALLNALNIERAHILGWSMGTFIAQELALQHPQRVDKLILLAGSCGGDKAVWPDDKAWQSLTDISGTLEERVQRMFSNLFPLTWLQENPDPSLYFPPITAPVNDQNLLRQAGTLRTWSGSWNRLLDLSPNTLIITGAKDSIIPPVNADLLTSRIPEAEVVHIHEGGHGFFFQYPELTAQVIKKFIEDQ